MGPIVSAIATALSGVAASIFGLIFNVIGIISGAFLWLAVNILNWVLSPNFISLSYTDPANNAFLEVGWGLTRDFANIIIVLALVVIGLGTALRLTGYQAQKALPKLIIIALLINFTPVICGLIVDAANILITFFIGDGLAGGNSFVNLATRQWSNIEALSGGLKLFDPIASQEAIAAAIGSVVLSFFNFYAALIYLIFAFLFALRYVAIWVLVILSPLAFACYILPDTRKVWTQWWSQFIQWSFIGVIAAFFLYLGDHFLMATQSAEFHSAESTLQEVGSAPGLSAILNNIMPFGIALVFLTIGLMLALSSSAAGANQITAFAQKKGGQAGQWISKRGKAFARSKVPEGVRRWAERQTAAKKFGEGKKGLTGWMARTASTPLVGMRRGLGGLVAGALNENLEFQKAYAKAKTQSTAFNMKDLRGPSSEKEKVAISKAMKEKNQWPEALDEKKFGKDTYTEGEILKRYENARNMGENDTADALEMAGLRYAPSFGAIQNKLAPDKYDENGLTIEDRDDRGLISYHQKIVRGLRTENDMKQTPQHWEDLVDPINGKKLIEYAVASPSFGSKQFEAAAMHRPSVPRKYLEFCKNSAPGWLTGVNKTTGRLNAPNAPRILSSSAINVLGEGMSFNLKEINQNYKAKMLVKQNSFLEKTYELYKELDRYHKELNSALRTSKDIKNDPVVKDTQKIITGIENTLKSARDTTGDAQKEKIDELEKIMGPIRSRKKR